MFTFVNYLILTTAIWDRHCFYLHFTLRHKKPPQLVKGQNRDFNVGKLSPEGVLTRYATLPSVDVLHKYFQAWGIH